MLNLNWEKNSLHNFYLSLVMAWELSPTHTHPLISIHELLKPYELLFFEFEFWPTPPHPYMTHPTLPHPFMTHPHPPLYDTPHPTLHDPPTPPPLPHPYMTHPTPPDPFMTHPPHPTPTPPLHDPPTPSHPTPSWFIHPTPPHPTPPLVHFWAQRSLFSWAASLCLPSVDNQCLVHHIIL